MIRIFLLGICMMILTTACIEPTFRTIWSKPGARQADFALDKEDCELNQGLKTIPGVSEFAMVDVCLEKEGWMRIEEPI